MKFLVCLLTLLLSFSSSAVIEDNSFYLEEGFNQDAGMVQFIQSYEMSTRVSQGLYDLTIEMPITDKVHQWSYGFEALNKGNEGRQDIGDSVLSYRYQSLNRDGYLMAERFGLILPTGSVEHETSNGVLGLDFKYAATIPVATLWMNHWNVGSRILPNSKRFKQKVRVSEQEYSLATSGVYLYSDHLNLILEAIFTNFNGFGDEGEKITENAITLNPGIRVDFDIDWNATQVVPGISFPARFVGGLIEQGILFYLSFEPNFN